MTPKEIKSFLKLFPKIKCPIIEEFDYYFEKQARVYPNYTEKLTLFKDDLSFISNELNAKSFEDFKFIVFDDILKALKDKYFDCFNFAQFIDNKFSKKDFKPEKDKVYVSFDLIEAGYQVFNKYGAKNELPAEFSNLVKLFTLSKTLPISKSFRQYVLGNLNPGRQQHFQKVIIASLVQEIKEDFGTEPVAILSDEVIYEYNEMLETYYKNKEKTFYDWNFKASIFEMEFHNTRYGNVITKLDYAKQVYEFYQVRGDRYFIYFNELFPQLTTVDERDFMFEVDGHVAEWIN